MFGTIRRHQQWLWIVIISLTILSFVIFFSPYQRVSTMEGGSGGPICYVANRPVTTAEFDSVLREVFLEFLCNNGFLPDGATMRQMGFNPELSTYQRVAALEKAKEMKLHASEEAAQRYAGEVVRRFQREGVNSYGDFVNRVLNRHTITGFEGQYQLSAVDFERFARNELIIQQLTSMSGLAGFLVTPQEAEEIYRRQNESIEAQVVLFRATNYLSGVQATPEAVAEYYTNSMANYRIGERYVLDFIRFAGSNYLTEADSELARQTNLSQMIDADYQQRGTNAFPEAKTPEEAKAKIKEEYRTELSVLAARRAANQFVTLVFTEETNRLQRLRTFATASNLMVQTTSAFEPGKDDGPKEFKIPATSTNLLARLSLESPVSSTTIRGEDAVYVIALAQRIPSENPPYESVRERVTEDFKQEKSLMGAQAAGAAAASAIHTNRAAGKSFDEACAAAQVTPVKLPAFSMSDRTKPEIESHLSLDLIRELVFGMSEGETSPFRSMPDGGFLIHLVRRLPVDSQKMKTELPQFMAKMRQGRMQEALGAWYRKLEETGYLQPARQPEPKGSPSGNAPSPG